MCGKGRDELGRGRLESSSPRLFNPMYSSGLDGQPGGIEVKTSLVDYVFQY